MAADKRTLAPAVVFFVGVIRIATMARPEFQPFRAVGVTQLVASGMCLGAGLVLFVMRLRGERS